MTKTRRFSPPPRAIGGAAPYDGMEQYALDEATDQDLIRLIRDECSPRWLVNEAKAELEGRADD
jgi:hypothetical protein